jgi:transcriptional regulator with XRE-family HTH domain
MQRKKLTVAEEFKTMLDELKERDSFHIDGAKVELAEQIYIAMEDSGVSEAELSRRLGVSRSYVNKVLKGTANLTIESVVKIARALDCEFTFELRDSRVGANAPLTRTSQVQSPRPKAQSLKKRSIGFDR